MMTALALRQQTKTPLASPGSVPEWFVFILALQLIFAFCAPPLKWGDRLVFFSDLWCWLWTPGILLWLAISGLPLWRELRIYFIATAILCLLAFGHGALRPSLQYELFLSQFWVKDDLDRFQIGREFVICVRFISWLWAGGIVHWIYGRASASEAQRDAFKLQKVIASCSIFGFSLMAISKLSLPFRNMLGAIYHYDPNYEYWINRMYGPFPSPVEAGVAYGLVALLLFQPRAFLSRPLLAAGVLCAIFADLLSRTLSPFVAFAAVIALYFWARLTKNRSGLMKVIATSAVLALAPFLFLILWKYAPDKLQNLNFRLNTWGIFPRVMARRWDTLVFGLGFAGYHADNSYLFLLTRGGLLAFLSFAFAMLAKMREPWKRWTWQQKVVIFYIFFVGLSFDVFIFRNCVSLMLGLGLLFLRTSENMG